MGEDLPNKPTTQKSANRGTTKEKKGGGARPGENPAKFSVLLRENQKKRPSHPDRQLGGGGGGRNGLQTR